MTALTIAVPAETVPGEHRVALVPDVAGASSNRASPCACSPARAPLRTFAMRPMPPRAAAWWADAAALFGGAGLVCKVQCPTAAEVAQLPEGCTLVTQLQPGRDATSCGPSRRAASTCCP